MDRRIYIVPDQPRSGVSPTIAAHRAHLSHYIAQLTSLEREQQRLALEQQLLARQQAQLTAKRDQLTYLIAEEQDLVIRALQQQRQQEREEQAEAAAFLSALAEREAQIARRQRLRYAVYRKQQEEQAMKDAEIQRILRFVQQPQQRYEQQQQIQTEQQQTEQQLQKEAFQRLLDEQQQLHYPQQQQQQQQQSSALSVSEASESDETPIRPGTISAFLRQQGIKPRELYSSSSPSAIKRGSRRGSNALYEEKPKPKPSADSMAGFDRKSAKLVPDVNYESAQDFLTALFGGAADLSSASAQSQSQGRPSTPISSTRERPSEGASPLADQPPAKQQKMEKPKAVEGAPTTAPSFDELMQMIFGAAAESAEPSATEPKTPFEEEYPAEPETATRPPYHYTIAHAKPSVPPPKFEIPAEAAKSPFAVIEMQIAAIRGKVLDASSRVEKISAEEDETAKRHKLLEIQSDLEKYYSDLDDILLTTPESESEDEEVKARRQELRKMKHEVTTMAVDTADKIDKILSPPSDSDEEDEEFEIVEREESAEMPRPGEEVIEGDEYFVTEKAGKDVILERAEEEKDESLDEEEKNEVKVPLKVAEDEDDTSVIVQASQPISRDETVEEVFVPEAEKASGKVLLEKNSGEEKEEFLDSEEENEVKVPLEVEELKKEGKRSESPMRHVVLEDVPDEE
ncbi:hypothetical protein BZA70DRAFT_277888 [Myxozyma melibiosi]|uniref:BAG domain-containing protein n=1 Tax=Myxozyma melibiosi TaxID=54550 RepID=A0ABR1F6B1_9ASCO